MLPPNNLLGVQRCSTILTILCVYGNSVIKWNANISTVYFARHFCIFFSGELNTTLVGSCPYDFGGIMPKNVSQCGDFDRVCSHLHRRGQLCGECQESYSLPVYYYMYFSGCVKCEDYKYGWVKFIAAAFLPLTVFYLIVIVLRISATSSALNGVVLLNQVVPNPTAI